MRRKSTNHQAHNQFHRISNLPDDLAHHIMSLLPMTDTARSAVLSKRWQYLWLTFPVHEFGERWFQDELRDNYEETCSSNFYYYLRRSLSLRDFNHMQKLRIITCLPHDYDLEHLVTRCVAKAILQSKVQELHLKITIDRDDPFVRDHCVFHRVIFSSGSCLVSLILEDFQFGVYHRVSFPLLKNLKLGLIYATNRTLIRNSPQLEILRLGLYHGFDCLRVFNPNVRILVVTRCRQPTAFEMDAPCRNYFNCNGMCGVFWDNASCYAYLPYHDCSQILQFKVLNGNSICCLETLVLSFVKIHDETFESMLSKFPNITKKLLSSLFGKMLRSTVLGKLKLVEMQNCCFHAPVEVNAPNLETFVHRGGYRRCALKHLWGEGFGNIKTLSLIGCVGCRE